jgi:hypothetical protein
MPSRLIYFDKIESAMSKAGFGFLLSILILISVTAIMKLSFSMVHHGNEFALLSVNPFNFDQKNDLQLRILSPLAGYLFFMRGPLFQYFMLIVLCAFFCMTYVFLRKKSFTISESVIFMSLLAFTTLSFHQFQFPAYTDPGSYLLIILLMTFHHHKKASTILISLLLLNHESNIAIFPFFFLLMAGKDFSLKNLIRISFQFAIAFLPYLLYRAFILSKFQPEYTTGYYFEEHNISFTREHVLPNLFFGVFQTFRLAWLIPLAAICIDIHEKRFFEIILMLSAILGVSLLFFVAYDISRLMCLAFPAIITGGLRLREFFGKRFIFMISVIFLLNFFIPSYYVGALEPVKYNGGWLF